MKKNNYNKGLLFILLFFSIIFLSACQRHIEAFDAHKDIYVEASEIEVLIDYNLLEDVALYIHNKGKLPDYYLTKKQAIDLGWVASKGNLWEVSYGSVIGGDRFYNREKLLPEIQGRRYYEADVNYQGGFRNAERIVFSEDGLIFYTKDHYETFELLYGDD